MHKLVWVYLQLIFPFLELDIKYFDLGLPHRDATDDKVTVESAEATLKYGYTSLSPFIIFKLALEEKNIFFSIKWYNLLLPPLEILCSPHLFVLAYSYFVSALMQWLLDKIYDCYLLKVYKECYLLKAFTAQYPCFLKVRNKTRCFRCWGILIKTQTLQNGVKKMQFQLNL